MKTYKQSALFLLSYITISLLLINPIQSQTLNILPLGNSITQSNAGNYSYRYYLWKKLLDAGVDFDFVGSAVNNRNGNPNWPQHLGLSFDQHHEGHSGWNADDLAWKLPTWLNYYDPPDIALIHAGTNDVLDQESNESTIQEIQDVITILRGDNPNITILLAQIIPNLHPFYNPLVVELNEMILSIPIDMYDVNSPIYIVDQYNALDPLTDIADDGVHPLTSGEMKMANCWFEALEMVLGYTPPIKLELNVFLEGSFQETDMTTTINENNFIPLAQPYSLSPWNYPGTEELIIIHDLDVVDWILVELRDTTSASLANPSSVIAQQAAFVKNDGTVIGINESNNMLFHVSPTNDLFVVIKHRNHLDILSANPLTEVDGVYSYDFTDSETKVYGGANSHKQIATGVWGMIGGDANADNSINLQDYTGNWFEETGSSGYYLSDFNLDGQVDNMDKNNYWLPNFLSESILPE